MKTIKMALDYLDDNYPIYGFLIFLAVLFSVPAYDLSVQNYDLVGIWGLKVIISYLLYKLVIAREFLRGDE